MLRDYFTKMLDLLVDFGTTIGMCIPVTILFVFFWNTAVVRTGLPSITMENTLFACMMAYCTISAINQNHKAKTINYEDATRRWMI